MADKPGEEGLESEPSAITCCVRQALGAMDSSPTMRALCGATTIVPAAR